MNIASLPKAELHRHVDLSMRPRTMWEVARELKLDVPASFADFKQEYLIETPLRDLKTVLKRFEVAQRLLDSEEILVRLVQETLEDASREGIRILEFRYAPAFVAMGHPNLDFKKIHRAFLKGIELSSHLPIAVGLIGILQRTLSETQGAEVMDFILENKDTFIGVDLADNERDFPGHHLIPLFQKAADHGLHRTIHAGEVPSPSASRTVRDAVELFGAERIGHGLHVVHDSDAMDWLRERRIPLEICPTSNWLTESVPSVIEHPIRRLFDHGVAVTVSTDDPGVFNLTLTSEYEKLTQAFGFTEAEWNHMNDIAAANSFLPLQQKKKVWPRPIRTELCAWT